MRKVDTVRSMYGSVAQLLFPINICVRVRQARGANAGPEPTTTPSRRRSQSVSPSMMLVLQRRAMWKKRPTGAAALATLYTPVNPSTDHVKCGALQNATRMFDWFSPKPKSNRRPQTVTGASKRKYPSTVKSAQIVVGGRVMYSSLFLMREQPGRTAGVGVAGGVGAEVGVQAPQFPKRGSLSALPAARVSQQQSPLPIQFLPSGFLSQPIPGPFTR
mmetsp:Transcript_33174/g.55882  ORF Transcript_33174/g.55882 Transcript_33174/m.55882 type:complete len:217 (+) Transcript_33174:451-1101(+)